MSENMESWIFNSQISEDQQFKDSLAYIVRLCLNKTK